LTADRQVNATDAGDDASPAPGGFLRTLQDDFAAHFASRAASLIGRELAVIPAGWSRQAYSEFLASLPGHTCCHMLAARGTPPPTGAAPNGAAAAHRVWVDADRGVAFALIDALLGGREGAYVPDRALTGVERGLLRHVVDLVAESLGQSWPGDRTQSFEVVDDESGCAVAPGRGEQPVTVAAFRLGLAGQTGALRLCLPEALLSAQRNGAQPQRRIAGPLEISVVTAEIDLSQAELADLSAGDILMTDTPADGEVIVRVAGIPKFRGRLGTCDGRRAVTITRRMGSSGDAAGASRADAIGDCSVLPEA